MLGPNLAMCQLVASAENAIKFMLKLSEKLEEKTKQKRGGYGVGNEMWEVPIELNPGVRPCGEVKKRK